MRTYSALYWIALILTVMGLQSIFTAFLTSMLQIKYR
jgi:hypothetical protein